MSFLSPGVGGKHSFGVAWPVDRPELGVDSPDMITLHEEPIVAVKVVVGQSHK